MARGKQATKAANRRAESAHEVIDRLTSELADAKIRARDAEVRAARLEGADKLVRESVAKNDELLVAALDSLKGNRRWFKTDRDTRRQAMVELFTVVADDIGKGQMGVADVREFMCRRYPHITASLMGATVEAVKGLGREGGPVRGSSLHRGEQKLEGESLRRFQRMCGSRTVLRENLGKDSADVFIDLLDAKAAEFTYDEMIEYATGVPQDAQEGAT